MEGLLIILETEWHLTLKKKHELDSLRKDVPKL